MTSWSAAGLTWTTNLALAMTGVQAWETVEILKLNGPAWNPAHLI